MKRYSIAILAALMALALVPAPSSARQGEEETQTVNGQILLITRHTSTDNGWPGLVRRAYQASRASNGIIGYVFDIDPQTWGGRFDLAVTGQTQLVDPADLGIYFYEEMADAGGQGAPVSLGQYENRKPGGETGFVTPGSRYGVVFMSRGFNVSFTYKAFTPMSVEVSEAGFAPPEVTVGSGGWVYFTNVGEDFHSVTSTTGAFDSSPTMKQPLIPGATFAVQFTEVGDYAYYDKFGTAQGVVHVVPGPGAGPPAS